ncbi:MAG TPA: glycosyltransferase family 2 protein [Opitutaceae bacterium]
MRQALNGPPSSDYCGFALALRLGPGSHTVKLEADVDKAGWLPFAEGTCRVGWPGYALSWRPDREFITIERQQAGKMPLRLAPQYPPRPLRQETFPAVRGGPRPAFAIVTPSFQQAAFLEAAMVSVLDQPDVAINYAVVDGGSTDGTRGVLSEWAPRLTYWRSAPDDGQADAVRRGFLALPRGPQDIMAYLNSDDALMPGALAFVAGYFRDHPEVDVVFGHRVLIDDVGCEIGRWATPRRAVADLDWYDLIPQETLFWRRRIWDRVGGIDANFKFALDWDLLLRFKAAGARFARLPWYLGLFRLHLAQKSQAQLERNGIPEMERLRERALGEMPPPHALWRKTMAAQSDSHRLLELLKSGVRR